jgi:Na+/phosphate symporter
MVAAARNAFNRHSRQDLESLRVLAEKAGAEINRAIQVLDTAPGEGPPGERSQLLLRQSILTRIQIIADNLAGLASPLQKKIKDGILFSDKAVAQTNQLFDRQAGVLRSVLDAIKTDNGVLKKFVLEEGQKLTQDCTDFATEHEARLIEGLCLPQAAPIFLAILDRIRTVARHARDIVHLLGNKE